MVKGGRCRGTVDHIQEYCECSPSIRWSRSFRIEGSVVCLWNGCTRHVCREDLLLEAYVKICRNDGSTTPGVDGQTVDGMSRARIKEIAQTLRAGDWIWKPVRRVHIP